MEKLSANKERFKVRCKHCGHEWVYIGENPIHLTCSWCRLRSKVDEAKEYYLIKNKEE